MAKKKSASKKVVADKVVIGVVDTMFARFDMGAVARDELASCPGFGKTFDVLSATVPGFKDLAVAAKNMIERDGADIVVALGMPGSAPIDKQCAHEASMGIMQAQLMTSTPILEVFVHEDESDDPAVLRTVFENRSRDHARNAYWMIFEPEELAKRAGQGVRQGFDDAGPLETKSTGATRAKKAAKVVKATKAKKAAPTTKPAVAKKDEATEAPSVSSASNDVDTTPASTTTFASNFTTSSTASDGTDAATAPDVTSSDVASPAGAAVITTDTRPPYSNVAYEVTTSDDEWPSDPTHPYRSGPSL